MGATDSAEWYAVLFIQQNLQIYIPSHNIQPQLHFIILIPWTENYLNVQS